MRVESGGVKQQVPEDGDKLARALADRGPGKHLWVMTGMWQIDPVAATRPGAEVHLDLENFLHIAGPGCYICEQPWTPGMAATFCPGDPTGLPRSAL